MSLARFALCASLFASALVAGAQNPAWSTNIHVPNSGSDLATRLVKAPDGSFFACGYDYGAAVILHYSSNGQLLWKRTLPGIPWDIAANSNSIAVGGTVTRSVSGEDLGYGTPADLFVARYDFAGNLIFQTVFPTTGTDVDPLRIGKDPTGNIVLATSRYNNIWMFRYGPTGTLLWTKSFLGQTGPQLGDMYMDANGCVLVGGEHAGANVGSFVAKVDNNAQTTWVKNIAGFSDATTVLVDGSGNIFAGMSIIDGLSINAQLVKMDTNGNTLWSAPLPGIDKLTGSVIATDGSIDLVGYDSYGAGYLCIARVTSAGAVAFNSVDTNYSSSSQSSRNITVDSSAYIYCGAVASGLKELVKYDSSGSFVWARSLGGAAGATRPVSLVMAASGPVGFGHVFSDATLYDFQFVGYDAAGNSLFESIIDSQELSHNANATVTDSAGNTYIAGSVGSRNGGFSVALVKVNANGTVVWRRPLAASRRTHSRAFGLRLTANGVLVATSWDDSYPNNDSSVTSFDSAGNVLWTSPTMFTLTGVAFTSDANGNAYMLLQPPSSSAPTLTKIVAGAVSWSKVLSGSTYSGSGSIAVDGSGNIYVSGFSSYGSTGLVKLDSAGNVLWSKAYPGQIFMNANGELFSYGGPTVTKYDASGAVVWSTSLDSTAILTAAAADNLGNIFAVGQVGSPSTDVYVAKLLSTGAVSWTRSFDLKPTEVGTSLASDGHGGVVVTGQSSNATDAQDMVTVKYDTNGNLLWPASGGVFHNGGAVLKNQWFTDDRPCGIGVDANGDVYVGGTTTNSLGESCLDVTKYDGLMAPDNALFVSQTVPSSMTAGQTYTVTVYMKNTGTATWTAAGGYLLSGLNGNTWSRATVLLSNTDSIAPGATKKFSFSVFAPTTAGTYPMQWRMSHNGAQFGMATALVNVPVSVRQNAARYLSQTVPTSVKAGSTFSVTVKMRNVGTTTWTLAAGQKLASTSPDMNTTWGTVTVPMGGADAIAQGQDKTFTFNCTAPLTPGSYTMRWRMYRSAAAFTGFFGDITSSRTITVTP